jgi:hypothetical protein
MDFFGEIRQAPALAEHTPARQNELCSLSPENSSFLEPLLAA